MILLIAKTIAVFFALFVIGKTTYDYKKKKESLVMFFFWETVWWSVIVLSLFPQVIDKIFGVGRSGINTFMGLVIVFLLYLSYRIYLKADRNERALQHIIKELAIKEFKEN